MRSSSEHFHPESRGAPCVSGDTLRRWNRRLHYSLGLFWLLFIWLFAFTGLLLNHSQWKFAEFWDNRRETSVERTIVAPAVDGDLDKARDVMRQLGLRGEIDWTAGGTDSDRLDFRVSRPDCLVEVRTDLAVGKAAIKRIDLNAWGRIRILHTFSGVRADDTRNQRDWVLTQAWVWAMDALAVGLILTVLSSLVMWWELPQKHFWGIVALSLGCLSCGLFWFGLRWLL